MSQHTDSHTVIDNAPVTYRGTCQHCEKTRLLHSQLITTKGDHNVCKVTCLTCQKSVTQ